MLCACVDSNFVYLQLREPETVLLRLRVDCAGGFPSLNQQRFGVDFLRDVANCSDMLLFAKKRDVGPSLGGTLTVGGGSASSSNRAAAGKGGSDRDLDQISVCCNCCLC